MTQALAVGKAAGPPEAKQGGTNEDKAEHRIFRLKYIPATEASRILRQLFGSRSGLSIAVDERTNSLVLSGGMAQLVQVEAILNKIDVEGSAPVSDAPVLKIFRLGPYGVDPDEHLKSMLQTLIPAGRNGRFIIDAGRRMVMLYADPTTQQRVQMLLSELGTQRDARQAKPATDLQVRLYWLVGGRGRRIGQDLPDNFKEIAGELGRLGMAQPRLATQMMIATEIGTRFETSTAVALPGSHDLTVSSMTTDRSDKVGLSVTISVNQSSRRSSRRTASLRTQVSVPFNKPVLLGVMPGEAMTSAFVVLLTRKKGDGLTGFDFNKAPWRTVFVWLARQTDKEVIAAYGPTGTFTFHGQKRTYTVGEVVDILNEALTAGAQKYLLIHQERQFLVVPADEKVDGGIPPRVSVEELTNRGKTELVRVMIPLRTLQAGAILGDVKKLLGPFGEAVAFESMNRLLIQDCAGNLRRVCELLKEMDQPKTR